MKRNELRPKPHVKSCNVKHNSESVFRYFASAVTVTRVQNVVEKIFMLSVVIEALKKSVMFLCVPFPNRSLIYSDWAFEVTLHSSSARRDSPCADSRDRDSGFT